MSQVLVRGLDEETLRQLKARAKGHGRSLQAELKLILETAARDRSAPVTMASARALADQIRAGLAGRLQSDSAELLAEDRDR